MNEMIERVARAILAGHDWTQDVPCAEGLAPAGWDNLRPDWQDAYRAMAHAAIQALREPTGAMVEAADLSDRLTREDYRSAWSAMIDTVLADGG